MPEHDWVEIKKDKGDSGAIWKFIFVCLLCLVVVAVSVIIFKELT